MFTRITDSIFMVSPGDQGTFPNSFSFYIEDKCPTLIDTPLTFWYEAFNANLGDRPVEYILSTHFHRDHTGCNHLFPGTRVLAHKDDIPAMISLDSFIQYYGLDQYGDQQLTDNLLAWLNWHPSPIHGQIEDGQIVRLGDIDLRVIHTPGHTPGHCVFYLEKSGMLFSGDIDLTSFGPWYGNINSDLTALINSIKKLIDLNPQVVCSGHKGVIDRNVRGQLSKYLDRIFDKENRVLKALEKPATLDELTHRKLVYGRWGQPESNFYFFEKLCILTHLRRLIELGQVEEWQGKYRATGEAARKCAQI